MGLNKSSPEYIKYGVISLIFRIGLATVFLILGVLSNLIGIVLNPVSLLVVVPFVLYLLKLQYSWGFLFIFCYYVGLFKLGPLLFLFDEQEIPIFVYSTALSVLIFTLGSYIPFSLTVWLIKHNPS